MDATNNQGCHVGGTFNTSGAIAPAVNAMVRAANKTCLTIFEYSLGFMDISFRAATKGLRLMLSRYGYDK